MTIDILALAPETCALRDADTNAIRAWEFDRDELIAFGNAIIERCAAELEEYGDEYYVNSDMTCGERNGIELAAQHVRTMKAPTP